LIGGIMMETDLWRDMVGKISTICVTGQFKRLQHQLEDLYRRAGVPQPAVQAYQDALLSLLADEEEFPMQKSVN
ncbi:MAG: hypothetical protein ACYCOU_11550, partial [Sulfobacillus sp.]